MLLSPEKNIDIKWQVLNEYIGAYKGDDDFKEYMDKDKDGFITEADYNVWQDTQVSLTATHPDMNLL